MDSLKMFKNLLIFGLATLALGAPKVPRQRFGGRIVGGVDVDITEHPHQVSLEQYGFLNCGGSIVHEKYVITAAHCTQTDAENLKIRVGTSTAESNGTLVQVKKINVHPKYDIIPHDYDISILELAKPLKWSDSVQPIGLPEADTQIAEGTVVNVTGWGVLNQGDDDISRQLQVVEVNIVSNRQCAEDYEGLTITDRMLCAASPKGGKDSCQGDSGGPLSADGVLLGIVSWGYGCAQDGYPGVYGNVTSVRSFIDEIVK